MVQTRSEDHVGGDDSYELSLHTERLRHTVCEVVVAATASNSVLGLHGTIAAHTRLLLAVGAIDSYWVLQQVLSCPQVRSEVDVAAVVSYSVTPQAVKLAQTRSEFEVGDCT